MKKFFTIERIELILSIAAYAHILAGVFIALLPQTFLKLIGLEMTAGVELLQFVGIVAIGAGIAYFSAKTDISRHWPIMLVGVFGNFCAAILFAKALYMGTLPMGISILAIACSVGWLIPLLFTLVYAYNVNTRDMGSSQKFDEMIKHIRTSQNKTILELSHEKPVLLMVTRHLGCVFCRETVSELKKVERELTEKNVTPVFVHMSDLEFGDEFFAKYYPGVVHHVSDPARNIYRSLNLKRADFYQMFGPVMWLRTVHAGLFKGYGIISQFEGDIHQMAGMFVISKGRIIAEQKAKSTSELLRFNNLPEF